MGNYMETKLWKRTLGLENTGVQENIRELRESYVNIREKAATIACEIGRSLPEYTVHDITHIDALWEMADLILPDIFEMTPAEGYVLGVSFLIHDLGMGLVAYTNGEKELKEQAIWKDIVANEFRKKYGKEIREEDWKTLDDDILNYARGFTLRQMHAKQAKSLPFNKWNFNGQDSFFIENEKLRKAYGEIIGEIAYSHWWDICKVKKEFNGRVLGAIDVFPNEWYVDALKLACIIRVADAMHIDSRRAPGFLMALRNPSDESGLHWIFQNKLCQPLVSNNKLLYTSQNVFTLSEREAWWICYDVLRMIDAEIKDVCDVLREKGYILLSVIGVCGVSSALELSQYIKIKDWIPVETSIRVGNVSKLVNNLGGRQLYGDNMNVPFRELVQNASDAVRARRFLEEDDYEGNITISLLDSEEGKIIEIEDDGVGMSKNVLMGAFLDFGNSFWNSQQMYEEFPGLSSRGFSSTGKYGIGFYSIFMWSEKVTVLTKRFDAGREQTLVLEFNNGANGRPVLRYATGEEQIKNGGTKIKVVLPKKIVDKMKKKEKEREEIIDEIAKVCPCMECNVWLKINDGCKKNVIHANDWLTISEIDFVKRLIGPNHYARWDSASRNFIEGILDNMRIIEHDGQIYGRAMICESPLDINNTWSGKMVVGGFYARDMYGILGVMIGDSVRASREGGRPRASIEIVQKWLKEQVKLLTKKNLPAKKQLEFYHAISRYWEKPVRLPLCIAYNQEKELTYNDIITLVKQNKNEEFIVVDAITLELTSSEIMGGIKYTLNENVIVSFTEIRHAILNSTDENDDGENALALANLIVDTILSTWEIPLDARKKHIKKWNADDDWKIEIGKIGGEKWEMPDAIRISKYCIE